MADPTQIHGIGFFTFVSQLFLSVDLDQLEFMEDFRVGKM